MKTSNSRYVAANGEIYTREGAKITNDSWPEQNTANGYIGYGLDQGFVGYGDTPLDALLDADRASDWQSHIQGACGGNNPLCPFCSVK